MGVLSKFSAAAAATLLLAVAPASAQSAAATIAATAVATPPIWRVSDADSEIYLLGSFHILPPGFAWRSEEVETALEAAETLWFEAEIDAPATRQKTLQVLMTQGFNSGGKSLSDLLDAADAERLTEIAASLGLPKRAIEPMRPWQAFLTLSVQFIVSRGFDPGSGVETALLGEARTRGRDLRFFETVEQQLGFFTALSPEAEKDLLVTTLREWDRQTSEFDHLFNAWATGDADAIDQMMNASLRDSAREVYEALVRRRNALWTDQIAREMAGSGIELVVVGAGHLVGEGSVPALLSEKGFTVERYSASDAAAGE